jgi:hypothetical protein
MAQRGNEVPGRHPLPARLRADGKTRGEDFVGRLLISADPDELVPIQQYVDLGFDRVYLQRRRNQAEWIEVFGRDVLPSSPGGDWLS